MIAAAILAAAITGVTSQASAPWRGWQRNWVGWDDASNRFVNISAPSLVESQTLVETLDGVAEIHAAASNAFETVRARANALAAQEGGRPVFLLTADYDMADALDRRNLTLVVPEWSYNPTTRVVTAWCFTNYVLASAPIVEARIRSATTGGVLAAPCVWQGYGVASRAREITVGGETFECYALTFKLPASCDAKSVDFSQWGRIGDPVAGFDIGNRQYRVNGELTYTSAATNAFQSILSIGAVVAQGDDGSPVDVSQYVFFTDNGLTKAAEKEEEEPQP